MRTILAAIVALVWVGAGPVSAQSPPAIEPGDGAAAPDADVLARECQAETSGIPYFQSTLVGGVDFDPPEEYLYADPCGLRNTDLSGLWRDQNGRQFVLVHDPRTGEFSMRHGYMPAGDELRDSWGIRIGFGTMEGRFHRDTMEATHFLVYPPAGQRACPEQAIAPTPSSATILNYDAQGNPTIHVWFAQMYLDYGTCEERFHAIYAGVFTREPLDP